MERAWQALEKSLSLEESMLSHSHGSVSRISLEVQREMVVML
jgi:hypothetical protein